jgi:superfamily II RNA helicase
MTSAPLAALLPHPGESASPDAVLDRFLGFIAASGLELYPAQEEAILELFAGKHLVLGTPTGSGKSLVATALHFKAMAEGKTSYYTCPIKALVNEKFFALCEVFGADNVGMLTGDAGINPEAKIICCTAEILSNRVLRELAPDIPYVVMDEFHYYADKERGVAWQIPLLELSSTTFLLMSATLGDTRSIEQGLEALTGRQVASVRSGQRPVPLDFEYRETPLHETIEDLVGAGKYPVYLVNFTQRAAAEQAQNLMSVNFSSKEEKEQIRIALQHFRFDTPNGKEISRFLKHGLGLHHAGLLPKYRLLVEKLAQGGHLKIISGTDTLGVGVNIPIRTVLFTQLCKFDGQKVGILSTRDFHQIAGRAGRKGFDDQGSVVAQAPEHAIENLRLAAKAAQGKKVVKRQPPTKGYAHWDRSTFDRLVTGTPEPLASRFEVTFGMLLNMLQSDPFEQGDGYRRLVRMVLRSHGNDYLQRSHLETAARGFRTLRGAGIVQFFRKGEAAEGTRVRVSPELQRDFSLHHTLSLYLVDTLEQLDPTTPTYALDVLTLVESILENPDVVLYAQLNKLKGDKVAELKAKGVEYDERMAELEKLEWPKPNRDFIYGTFNAFEARHPWVGAENIRPKSIARDMVERFCTFNDYVREYGLQRSEGVLLRYLSETYKALLQNVPEAQRTEELEDLIAGLRVMLRAVDSSLVDEWERLRDPTLARVVAPEEVALGSAKLADPTRDMKRFTARVRAELHRLLKAVASKDWEEAQAALFVPEQEVPWTAERFEAELGPFFEAHGAVDLTPRARQPLHTTLREEGPRSWRAQQRMLDPDGEGDWMLDCVIDLAVSRPDDAPLITLRRIGT